MIFNDDVLFLHIPKTAGKSLALALVTTIDRPIVCRVPPGTENMLRETAGDLEGVTIERSNGHENLRLAARTLPECGRSITDFKMILAVIRNPYDLMVSNYHFMRQSYENNTDRANFVLAHESDFETYTRSVGFMSVERWLSIDGVQPDNLRILRFETLQDDFSSALAELGYQPPELPVVNDSQHGHFSEYLTPGSEAAIYDKFRYLFDGGYYERVRVT